MTATLFRERNGGANLRMAAKPESKRVAVTIFGQVGDADDQDRRHHDREALVEIGLRPRQPAGLSGGTSFCAGPQSGRQWSASRGRTHFSGELAQARSSNGTIISPYSLPVS